MNRADLQKLSNMRVREAKVLLDAGHYAGSYYLLGYAVECAIKAAITKQVMRYDFPNKALAEASWKHDLTQLLKTAALDRQLTHDAAHSPGLTVNWAVVKDWSETRRYDPTIGERLARDMYAACTVRRTGVLPWLKHYW